jgi:hypothetical protein
VELIDFVDCYRIEGPFGNTLSEKLKYWSDCPVILVDVERFLVSLPFSTCDPDFETRVHD